MELAAAARRVLARLFERPVHRGRIIALAIVAAGGLVALTSLNLRLPFAIPGTGLLRIASQEPHATAQFMRGQQTFDAHLIWESYSDRVVEALEERGVTVDDTQRHLDRLRQTGSPIQNVQYIGGAPIPTGSMQFYLVTRPGRCPGTGGSQVQAPTARPALTSFAQQGCREPVYVPYVFTLDDRGKIDRVE